MRRRPKAFWRHYRRIMHRTPFLIDHAKRTLTQFIWSGVQ